MKKIYSLLLVSACATSFLVSCSNGGGSNTSNNQPKKVITIDGGGDIANFNTTASMTESPANPYPYNTLEKLCDEWEALNPGYEVRINKTSSGGDRSVLLPQLKSHTAPDITYQNGSVVNTDLGQGYYVDLTPYLEKENPYLENKAAWKTVYNEGELATTQAADGKYYYIDLEKIPVAFMYNKTLLAEAGVQNVDQIQTFGQLLEAMAKCYAYTSTKGAEYATYTTTYTWYQIAMESNLFSNYIEQGDVLRKNNMIDTEELCRLFQKGIWNPTNGITDFANPPSNSFENNDYYEYIRLIQKLDAYKAPATYAANSGWLSGKVGFLEATGAQLRSLSANTASNFEWGTICFPDITTEDSAVAGKGVVRGSAGLATSWWVTASAIDGNKVDACVDLLMFLTAPQYNNRLIGDLKGGIPLNPSEDYEIADYLKPLIEQYDQDMLEAEQGNRCYWGSVNSWAVLGISYSTLFQRTMQELDAKTITLEQATCTLARAIRSTVQSYIVEYEYDTSKW